MKKFIFSVFFAVFYVNFRPALTPKLLCGIKVFRRLPKFKNNEPNNITENYAISLVYKLAIVLAYPRKLSA